MLYCEESVLTFESSGYLLSCWNTGAVLFHVTASSREFKSRNMATLHVYGEPRRSFTLFGLMRISSIRCQQRYHTGRENQAVKTKDTNFHTNTLS